ncbi:MAG: hypothetical protein ACREAG_04645 [Nitrosopumilaceae archaeon]
MMLIVIHTASSPINHKSNSYATKFNGSPNNPCGVNSSKNTAIKDHTIMPKAKPFVSLLFPGMESYNNTNTKL